MSSLKRLALKGAVWTFIGYGLKQSFRLVNNLILTRLLAPEIFGLSALVNTLRVGLELFSDVGIPQNIIQSKRGDDPDFLDTAWTIQVMRGALIWIVICLISVPVAIFYGEPQLWQVLPVVGLANLVTSLHTVRYFSLNRHIQLGKITVFELVQQIFSLAVMVAIAIFYPTIWALVIGTIAGSAFKVVGSYLMCPGPFHKFFLEMQARKEITGFGRWIFLNSIFTFLAQESDRLILGKLIPLETLGVYTIAVTLATLPKQVVTRLSMRVIFPVISKQAELPRKQLRRKILRQRGRLLMLLYSVYIAFVCFGDYLINFMYDDRYQAAGWMVTILTLGSWVSILYLTGEPCLFGIGKPSYGAQSKILRFVIVAVGIIIGYNLAGVSGAVAAVAFSDLPAYAYLSYGLHRESLGMWKQDSLLTVGLFGTLAVILLGRAMAGLGTPIDSILIG